MFDNTPSHAVDHALRTCKRDILIPIPISRIINHYLFDAEFVIDAEKLCIVVPLRDNQLKSMRCFKACDFELSRFDPSAPMIIPSHVSKGGMGLYGMHTPAGTEIVAATRDPVKH